MYEAHTEVTFKLVCFKPSSFLLSLVHTLHDFKKFGLNCAVHTT